MYSSRVLQLLAVHASFTLFTGALSSNETQCRVLPGDLEWPNSEEWNALNSSVSGRLIKTSPAGHVCHDPTYNEEACTALNSSWIYPWAQ
jgi:hypothetical protein